MGFLTENKILTHDGWAINHLQKWPKELSGHRKSGNTRVKQRCQGANSQGSWNCSLERKESNLAKGETNTPPHTHTHPTKKSKESSGAVDCIQVLWLLSLGCDFPLSWQGYFVRGQQQIFKQKTKQTEKWVHTIPIKEPSLVHQKKWKRTWLSSWHFKKQFYGNLLPQHQLLRNWVIRTLDCYVRYFAVSQMQRL